MGYSLYVNPEKDIEKRMILPYNHIVLIETYGFEVSRNIPFIITNSPFSFQISATLFSSWQLSHKRIFRAYRRVL